MFTPIQLIKDNLYLVGIVPTNELDKGEHTIRQASGIKRGGTFLHGPACSAEEASKYNEGFSEGVAIMLKHPVIKIDAEKKTITTTKKRKIKK